jgi:REP element-mobilizing transposase RayT
MPNRPPRLHWIFQQYDPPLYFITFNTSRRRKLLANAAVHNCFLEFANAAEERGIGVGKYVIMPDHLHMFVRNHSEMELSQWIRLLKRHLSKAILNPAPHWQPGFFDHLIRHGESYSQKWEYVYQNPVRGSLVKDPDSWPYQGEILGLQAM